MLITKRSNGHIKFFYQICNKLFLYIYYYPLKNKMLRIIICLSEIKLLLFTTFSSMHFLLFQNWVRVHQNSLFSVVSVRGFDQRHIFPKISVVLIHQSFPLVSHDFFSIGYKVVGPVCLTTKNTYPIMLNNRFVVRHRINTPCSESYKTQVR